MRLSNQWVWALAGYAVAAVCLIWVFHGVSVRDLWHSLAAVRWWWLGPAVVLDLLVYGCAAWEWQLLLRPVRRLSLRQTAQALFAGRFANDVLPVHAGYIIRVYLASRWAETTVAAIVPSLLIERLVDGLWLALSIALTIMFFPLPAGLDRAGEILGGLIIAGVIIVMWIAMRPASTAEDPAWSRRPWVRKPWAFVTELIAGVRSVGRSRLLFYALVLSFAKLVIQCLAFLSLIQSYGFAFTLSESLAVFIITYVGMSMPSTPASVGVFQLFCAGGLRFFHVPRADATAFALLSFVVLTAPLAIAGAIAATHSGLNLSHIRQQVRRTDL